MALGSEQTRAGTVAAQAVAAIAAVELPVDQWPELISLLLEFVNRNDKTTLKIATLQAIGFICETIVRRFLFFSMIKKCHILMTSFFRLLQSFFSICIETRDPEQKVKRNPHSRHSWCTQRGAIAGCSVGRYPRPLQLARVRA
jgi:hypothetical protein